MNLLADVASTAGKKFNQLESQSPAEASILNEQLTVHDSSDSLAVHGENPNSSIYIPCENFHDTGHSSQKPHLESSFGNQIQGRNDFPNGNEMVSTCLSSEGPQNLPSFQTHETDILKPQATLLESSPQNTRPRHVQNDSDLVEGILDPPYKKFRKNSLRLHTSSDVQEVELYNQIENNEKNHRNVVEEHSQISTRSISMDQISIPSITEIRNEPLEIGNNTPTINASPFNNSSDTTDIKQKRKKVRRLHSAYPPSTLLPPTGVSSQATPSVSTISNTNPSNMKHDSSHQLTTIQSSSTSTTTLPFSQEESISLASQAYRICNEVLANDDLNLKLHPQILCQSCPNNSFLCLNNQQRDQIFDKILYRLAFSDLRIWSRKDIVKSRIDGRVLYIRGRCRNNGLPASSQSQIKLRTGTSTKCNCKAAFKLLSNGILEFEFDHNDLCQPKDVNKIKKSPHVFANGFTPGQEDVIIAKTVDFLRENNQLAMKDLRKFIKEDLLKHQPVGAIAADTSLTESEPSAAGAVDVSNSSANQNLYTSSGDSTSGNIITGEKDTVSAAVNSCEVPQSEVHESDIHANDLESVNTVLSSQVTFAPQLPLETSLEKSSIEIHQDIMDVMVNLDTIPESFIKRIANKAKKLVKPSTYKRKSGSRPDNALELTGFQQGNELKAVKKSGLLDEEEGIKEMVNLEGSRAMAATTQLLGNTGEIVTHSQETSSSRTSNFTCAHNQSIVDCPQNSISSSTSSNSIIHVLTNNRVEMNEIHSETV